MLSLLLFILAINLALHWIDWPDQGHAFQNSTQVPVAAYCDDITLISSNAAGMEEAFTKLIAFGMWVGLEINPAKSVYMMVRGRVGANLSVPSTHNGIPTTTPVPSMAPDVSY